MDLLLAATHRAEQRHFWFRGFRRFVTPLLDQAAAGRANLRVLDCGCGTGHNLALLARYGKAWGFDLTWTGLAFAQREACTRIAQASVTHPPFPDACFDILTSFDVLYCLEEPDEGLAVREMHRLLKPGGWLIVNVAAMPILHGNHSVLSQEVRRYDRPRLRRVLEAGGFQIDRLGFTYATLFPLMLAVRVAQRVIGLAPAEDAMQEITVPPAPINGLLSACLALEAGLARAIPMPFGSSLLCLARKPA